MKNITWLLYLILFITVNSFAQEVSYSKLKAALKLNLPDTTRVNTLNKLAGYFLERDGKQAQDSMFSLAESAKALSYKAGYIEGQHKSLIILSDAFLNIEDISKARKYANEAIIVSKKYNRKDLEALSYMALAKAFEGKNKDIDYGKYSVNMARQLKNDKLLANLLTDLAVIYNHNAKFHQSITCADEALKLYSTLKLKVPVKAYGYLADSYTNIGVYEQAVKFGLAAIQEVEKNGASNYDLFNYYSNVGNVYNYMFKYKLSEKYSRKAFNCALKLSDTTAIYVGAYAVFSDIFRQKGRAKEAKEFITGVFDKYNCTDSSCLLIKYLSLMHVNDELGLKAESEKYCSGLLKFIDENGESLDIYDVDAAYGSVAQHYFIVKEYGKARIFLNKTQKYANELGLTTTRKDMYRMGYKLDSIQGNMASAFKNYQAYVAINDSLLHIANANQISHYQAAYESVKKDENIHKLTLEGQLREVELDRQKRTVIVVVLLLLVISVIMAALYFRNRVRKKHTTELERKQLEIEAKNKSLGKLVTEKEWLLKEIHHRVKNNLQIVMSLLNSQSHYLKDKAAITAIRDSQHRVNSISLIHQKLYQSENLASIGMVAYIHDLVSHLKDSFDAGKIIFEVKVDNIDLDVSQAVPIGLILNEAITNAMKYAFKDRVNGKIKISLTHQHDDVYELTIEDNGVGMPEDYNISGSNSLGMTLIRGLSEDLEGEFTIFNNNGTVIKTSFIKDCFMDRRDECEEAS